MVVISRIELEAARELEMDAVVREGVDGFTIQTADLSANLAAILARLHAEPALRERMGRNARERVERQFSLRTMVERYASLLDSAPDDALR